MLEFSPKFDYLTDRPFLPRKAVWQHYQPEDVTQLKPPSRTYHSRENMAAYFSRKEARFS